MRKAFIETLVELAKQDERIVLLTGDLGYLVIEPFADTFPKRFYNIGVAEQNMLGVATGLAEAGMLPFCYSINTFASLRPFEFIRNGPVLHQLPVRIVAVGGGFEYGGAGHTHHGLEDVGVMRTQNGLIVVAPADANQTRTALNATWDHPQPVYYRLGKNDRDNLNGFDGSFELGKLQMIQQSAETADVLFLTMGSIALNLPEAVQKLAEQGVTADAGMIASIAPPPIDDLIAVLPKYKLVITAEAHTISGGIGSLVGEVIAENRLSTYLIRNAVRSAPDGRSGPNAVLNRQHGLDADSLVETAHKGLAILS